MNISTEKRVIEAVERFEAMEKEIKVLMTQPVVAVTPIEVPAEPETAAEENIEEKAKPDTAALEQDEKAKEVQEPDETDKAVDAAAVEGILCSWRRSVAGGSISRLCGTRGSGCNR